jgi:hypothetical protein
MCFGCFGALPDTHRQLPFPRGGRGRRSDLRFEAEVAAILVLVGLRIQLVDKRLGIVPAYTRECDFISLLAIPRFGAHDLFPITLRHFMDSQVERSGDPDCMPRPFVVTTMFLVSRASHDKFARPN